MQLLLRKCATDEVIRLSGAKVLCRRSRKLALLAPYAGQWVFYSLPEPGSARLLYNRVLAPKRCPVAVGDLLNLNGLELVVDSLEAEFAAFAVSTSEPLPCEIEVPGEGVRRITQDTLVGFDPSRGLCLAATLDSEQLTALLTFAAGRWHLHELTGKHLFRNGKAVGTSLVVADGDRVRIQDKEIRFRIGTILRAPAISRTNSSDERDQRHAGAGEITKFPVPSSQEKHLVHREAKELCQQLWLVLREPGLALQPKNTAWGGFRGWLRVFRRPSNPTQTLERLHFLLSGSPCDRVWLLELARFLFQQSYCGLCLRLLKELNRLYPKDAVVGLTLAKFYYHQGCNFRLPLEGRLNACEHAQHCTQRVRQLVPRDQSGMDLEQAVRAEQATLKRNLARMTSDKTSFPEPVEVVGRME